MLALHKTTVVQGQTYCPASLVLELGFTIHLHKPLLLSLPVSLSLSLSPPLLSEAGALFHTIGSWLGLLIDSHGSKS